MNMRNWITFVLSILIFALVFTNQVLAQSSGSHNSNETEYVSEVNTGASTPAVEKKKNSDAVRRYLLIRLLISQS